MVRVPDGVASPVRRARMPAVPAEVRQEHGEASTVPGGDIAALPAAPHEGSTPPMPPASRRGRLDVADAGVKEKKACEEGAA